MLGAIIGDIVGSVYEFNNNRSVDFPFFANDCFFTDDTVLTVATADVLMKGANYGETYRNYALAYPGRGYGGGFLRWVESGSLQPYGSFGNGSAMRVAPVGFAFRMLDETLAEAERSAKATHNHPEGIKGAQATAAAMFLARTGGSKEEIKRCVTETFHYDLSRTTDQIRPVYKFDETCQGTVPEALIAFLESNDFEHAIRLAISLGGDSDTLACITGGVAEAYYGRPPAWMGERVQHLLKGELWEQIDAFYATKVGSA